MNKKLVVIALAIVIVIGGAAAYLVAQNGSEQTAQTPGQTQNQPDSPDSTQASAGSYEDYDESKVMQTKGTKILFFHAPWCPQCIALEASIKNSNIPEGVTIFKVDYDSNQLLRQKYGVTIQTTLVKIDDQGDEIEKYVAYDKPEFEAVKANLLE